MSEKFQVLRGDAVIGEHDEQTLLALLNAGSLRLSDKCRRDERDSPTSLAEWVCRSSSSRTRWRYLVGATVLTGLIAVIILASRTGENDSSSLVQSAVASHPNESSTEGAEIRRGLPVIRGRIEFGGGMSFPRATVNQLASHSRVTVLGLAASGSPCALASGFAVDDGHTVVTSLNGVAGATSIELHLPDGRVERPANVRIDREARVVIFTLVQSVVALRWASSALDEGSASFIAGHALGVNEDGLVLRVANVLRGERRVHYQFAHALPPSYAGSAVLDHTGDAVGLVIDPDEDRALRSADVIAAINAGTAPEPIASLAAVLGTGVLPRVAVIESQVNDGGVVTLLRNETGATVRKALLDITLFAAPPEAKIVQGLEAQLREAAAHAGRIEGADGANARQRLREITAQLEAARQRLHAALAAAAVSPRVHRELHAVECEWAPSTPCRVALPADAGTGAGVMVTVLEVEVGS